MRLPWPFGRTQRAPAASGATASGRSGPKDVAARQPATLGAWRQLPPIAPVVQPAPLVAPTAPFAADLRAGNPPPPVLAPLSHGHGLDAPQGLVVGLARPARTAPVKADLPPVQRKPASKPRSAVASPSSADAVDSPPETSTAASPIVASAVAEPEMPVRRLSVASSETARAPRPMARLGERESLALAPARVAGVVGQPRAAGATRPAGTAHVPLPLPMPSPTAALSRASTPVSAPSPAAGASSRKAKLAPAEPGPLQVGAAGRLTLGQSRRLGLGAPIAAVPSTAAPVESKPTPLTLQRAPAQPKAEITPAVSVGRESSPLSTGVHLTRDDHVATLPALTPEPVRARPIGNQGPATAGTTSSPVLSQRPIRTGVQRAPLAASAPARPLENKTASATSTASRAPVRVHRGDIAAQLADSYAARSFTHQGEIYLPSSAGPIGSPTARALLAHEMVHVVQQRKVGDRLPAEHTSSGQHLEAEAVAAETRAPMPLVQQPQRRTEPEHTPSDSAPAVQRRPDTAPAATPAYDAVTMTVPMDVQRAPGDRPGTGTSPKPNVSKSDQRKSEVELEELAAQLYGRIARRLRGELLVDRERAGLMVDLP